MYHTTALFEFRGVVALIGRLLHTADHYGWLNLRHFIAVVSLALLGKCLPALISLSAQLVSRCFLLTPQIYVRSFLFSKSFLNYFCIIFKTLVFMRSEPLSHRSLEGVYIVKYLILKQLALLIYI